MKEFLAHCHCFVMVIKLVNMIKCFISFLFNRWCLKMIMMCFIMTCRVNLISLGVFLIINIVIEMILVAITRMHMINKIFRLMIPFSLRDITTTVSSVVMIPISRMTFIYIDFILSKLILVFTMSMIIMLIMICIICS